MGRIKVNITAYDLKKHIDEAESNNTFANRQQLAEFIEQTDWAKNYKPKPITSSVVLLRISEFGIEPKTPKVNVVDSLVKL